MNRRAFLGSVPLTLLAGCVWGDDPTRTVTPAPRSSPSPTQTMSPVGTRTPPEETGDSPASKLYQRVLDSLDTEHNGFGYDPSSVNEKRHWPMAYALIASAEAKRYEATGDAAALSRAQQNAEWLYRHRDRNDDGRVGWGLPVAWDAFANGVTNPRDAEYLITTALAGRALLDVAEIDSSADRRSRYVSAVERAVEPYVEEQRYNEYESGICFWYSPRAVDSYDVLNPSAVLTGLLQRLSTSSDVDSTSQSTYRRYADRSAEYLLDAAERYDDGIVWWYYGEDIPDRENIYNDLVHAAYVVDGLLTYAEYGGQYSDAIDRDGLVRGLELFRSDGELRRYVNRDDPARLWGVGHLLYALTRFYSNHDYQSFVFDELRNYEERFSFAHDSEPGVRGFGAVRHTAHLLHGLVPRLD